MKLERIQISALYLFNALGIIFYLFSLLLQPYELSYGLLSSSFAWFCFALIPAILPLFYDMKSKSISNNNWIYNAIDSNGYLLRVFDN
jgi:hypothetical protein